MLVSFDWLKKYVHLPDSTTPEEVADKLKMSTVEVENIIQQGAGLNNVVVGKIIAAEKHPNADKLKVCSVDIGSEQVTIVCGGSNVAPGMLVAVAKNGAKVRWHGEGELVELAPATIRGVESNGMICGADEIGLIDMFPKKDEKEIVDVTARGYKVGMPLAEALNNSDSVFEIDNKSLSNRPDLWGHYGMAREVAVLTNREVEKYKTQEIKAGKELKIKVEIEDEKLCPRYMAVAMSGIKVGESPEWLQQKLIAVGLRPINVIVDVTNYVMLDIGQPMHAFDAKKIVKNNEPSSKITITVRRAQEGERFVTLDGTQREVNADMLLITNGVEPLAVAGVMGGEKSGISSETTSIVFEAANFDAASIRKTSTKLGLRTDSSARFEKSLDPNQAATALMKAVELVLELCPGSYVASKVVDEKHFRLQTGPLEVPLDFFAKKIGVEIPVKTIVTILERLGFVVQQKKKALSVKIPTWRATKDISIPEDIVEEVIRIYGYDNVLGALPTFSITPPEKNELRLTERAIADVLVHDLTYTEVCNYSFVSRDQIVAIGENTDMYLELDNPLSKEKPYLRRYLLLNLLENIKRNIANYPKLKLFEIGKAYRQEIAGQRVVENGDELLPKQDTYLTSVYTEKKNTSPFWEARRVIETLGKKMNLAFSIVAPSEERPERYPSAGRHPSRSADVLIGDTFVGSVYELHPMVGARFGIEERVAVAQINVSKLADSVAHVAGALYSPLSLYPEVTRDIACIVSKRVTHEDISRAIRGVDPKIKTVELFDVYEGTTIGEGYKSMAFRLTYSHPDKTLTSSEIDAISDQVIHVLQQKFGAEVRK